MLTNLSPRFIEELGSPNPQPFAILEIEGAGQSDEATTEAHWTANIPGGTSNVEYDSTPGPPENSGDVVLTSAGGNTDGSNIPPTDDLETGGTVTGDYTDVDEQPAPNDGDFIQLSTSSAFWTGTVHVSSIQGSIPRNAKIYSVKLISRVNTGAAWSNRIKVNGTYYTDAQAATGSFTTITSEWTQNPDTGPADWTFDDLADIDGFGTQNSTIGLQLSWCYIVVAYYDFVTSGNITVELDLGADVNTSNNATVSIDDNVPTDSGLTYTLEGSDAGDFTGEEDVLGSVIDGSSVAAYRYYRPTANFTGDGSVTPVLKSIKIGIPDRVYRFTSRAGGIFNALPYLSSIPGRTISIDLKDFVTLGSDLEAGLQKDESVVQMLRENYFKNLHASIQIGMYREDITESDLAYTFQGKVDGYRVGMEEVSISLKDGTKDLSAKWPAGIPTPKAGIHMVDVIKAILDDVEIAARYISEGSLDTLKATVGDGSPASANYVVYRDSSPPVAAGDTTITEPETAKKVVGELLELLGAFMVSQEDGRIYVVEYSSSQASVGVPWTVDDFVEDPIYNPDVENLINDTFVYFDWNGEGTDADDFLNLETSPDNTSITNWGETNTRIIKSKWLAGSAADGYYGEELAIHIGARETERRKNGMGVFPVKTSLAKFETQTGDMVDIDMSDLIINPDVGDGDVRKFMVVSKDPDWANDTISWYLVEAR
jgi:hypothetical protein